MKVSSLFLAVACLVAGMLVSGCDRPNGPFYITTEGGAETQVNQPTTYNFYLPVGCTLSRLDITFPDGTSSSIVRDGGGDHAEFFRNFVTASAITAGFVEVALYHFIGGMWVLDCLPYAKAEAPDGGEKYTITKVYNSPINRGVIEATAETSCGTYGANLAIKVVPQTKPVAYILSPGQNSQVLVGGQVTFAASDAGASAQYVWQFSSGEVATGQSFSTVFAESEVGNWWVSLTVNHNGLASDPYTIDFSVVTNAPPTIDVPVLSGLPQDEAEDAITGTCLVLGGVSYESSETVLSGRVIRYSPVGRVPCGTTIHLVISTGPAADVYPTITLLELNRTSLVVGETLTIRARFHGSPSHHFKLVLSCAGKKSGLTKADAEALEKAMLQAMKSGEKGLPTQVFNNATIDRDYEVSFEVTMEGGAYASVYVEDTDNGQYATSSQAYSVSLP